MEFKQDVPTPSQDDEQDGIVPAIGDEALTDKEIAANTLEAIMMASEFVNEQIPVTIKRWVKGKEVTLLHFVVHALDEATIKKARTQAMRPKWNQNTGKKPVMELDSESFNATVIYEATNPEYKKELWDNPQFMKQTGVQTNIALITKLLKPGEKAKLAVKISEMSGFVDDEESLIETAKNS